MLFEHPLHDQSRPDGQVSPVLGFEPIKVEQHLVAFIAAKVMCIAIDKPWVITLRDFPTILISKVGTLQCRHGIELLEIRTGSSCT